MEPVFIYYSNLSFDQNKRFTLEFSNSDLLKGVIFKKNKDYYITSMSCYVDLTVDVAKLPQFDKIKEISDLANAILADDADFCYQKTLCKQGMKERATHLKLIKQTGVNTLTISSFFILTLKRKDSCMSIHPTKN